ncbi:exodeoxyribonuclease III [Auraticoccus sp. F435]|uniref:Exodeoxyribonuclease III n=1 Tax=Auraticoccus cholistanensis TaxID=2656650 RepID=A0A6A9UWH1_9ACTN|nr:exodeoxyribonuclease III [Auraticoccus cholistanensis]
MLRLASANVNGIRAAVRRGLPQWLEQRRPDVVALQEVRCEPGLVPPLPGWHLTLDAGTRAGRNGVAVLSREVPSAVRTGIGNQAFADEGRYLEVDLDRAGLTVASLYLPKGDRPGDGPAAEARYRRKLRFMASLARQLTDSRRAAARQGREFVVMGDFNIAHTELDLASWRTNRRSPGFLPEEREWFGSLLGSRRLVDVVRRLHPGSPGPYSWWTWRGQAFSNDAGWRIDYQLASPGLAGRALRGGTDREPSYEARMSDHSPVVVDYALPPA